MRINVFVANATGLSRRAADKLIIDGKVTINNAVSKLGDQVNVDDKVKLNGKSLLVSYQHQTIILNKPLGYVCSRNGQGSKTIYDLLPDKLHRLKPVGRLDKNSSGLLMMTSDGTLANQLTHPSFNKQKIYEVEINKSLKEADYQRITKTGVNIGDNKPSRLQLKKLENLSKPVPNSYFLVTISEGRNRQIRRTFAALGYKVKSLHRKQFGDYKLNGLTEGKYLLIK